MVSIRRGEESDSTDPLFQLHLENPASTPVNPAVLEFRILDISDAAKRAAPVQVYPALDGTWEALDPTQDVDDGGHRIATGHFYAPWVCPVDEALGDHEIEWRYKLTAPDEYEIAFEEFYVAEAAAVSGFAYCGVADLRREGYTASYATDDRINMLARLATLYIDKMCGRWFTHRVFDSTNRLKLDGNDAQVLHLDVPIIRLDALYLESQAYVAGEVQEIDLSVVRVYNRHMQGLTAPDDRDEPKIAFIRTGRDPLGLSTVGIYPEARLFPKGYQTVHLEGVFGYTDPDGTPFGRTPDLIRQVACRLVARDLRLDSDSCNKLATKNKFRIIGDKQGNQTITLQQLWLKGAFTGDPEIDQILMAYRRPTQIGAV